jgi:DNA-directed RNA polymerase specialized sigma24 family protein
MAGKQREFPTDPTDAWQEGKVQFGARNKLYPTRPMTEIEALMETAPAAGEPSVSLETTFLLKELLADAIEELSPLEKWIAERLFIENMSLRKAGAVLGIPKTSLARRRDIIRRKLEIRLMEEPVVTDWFKKRKQSISFGDETLPDQTH